MTANLASVARVCAPRCEDRLSSEWTSILAKAMEAGADATRALLAETRLKPAILGLPVEFKKDEAEFSGNRKAAAGRAVCSAIGCPRMSTWLCPPVRYPSRSCARRMSVVCGSLRCACTQSLKLAIEYVSPVHLRKLHPYEFIYRMDEMLDLAKDAGPNAGLMLDSWHWHHAGATAQDIAGGRQGAHRLRTNCRTRRSCRRPDKGQRATDARRRHHRFHGFLWSPKKIGYNGGVSPRGFWAWAEDIPPEEREARAEDDDGSHEKGSGVVIRRQPSVLAVVVCTAPTADAKLAEAYWEWERPLRRAPLRTRRISL